MKAKFIETIIKRFQAAEKRIEKLECDVETLKEILINKEISNNPPVSPAAPGLSEEELQAAEKGLSSNRKCVSCKVNTMVFPETIECEECHDERMSEEEVKGEPEELCSKCIDNPVVFTSDMTCKDCHVPVKRNKSKKK